MQRITNTANTVTGDNQLATPTRHMDIGNSPHTIDHVEKIFRLPTRPIRGFWYHSSLVRDSWLCFKLVQVIPVFPLFSCKMQQRLFILPHLLMWRSLRFCPRSYTFHHVHHFTKYSHLISVTQPSPVCRRHAAFLLFLPTRSSLEHLPPPDCFTRNFF